ncbi:unnamed protein product [marine sediment metagenome]|uniref:beta-lactamase n=1 Tax=marine sediment metagenome TaxID=412755 RepID=X1IJG2_9ZZZZ
MSNNPLNLEDILTDRATEDDLLEVPLTVRVFQIFFSVALIGIFIIVVQVVNIGFIDHTLYKKSALANITHAKSEPAPRGIIKDRFGNPLVRNEPAFRAFLSLRGFPKSSEERYAVLGKLSEILEKERSELVAVIEGHDWRLGRLLLSDNLSHNTLVALTSQEIPGLEIEPGFSRVHVAQFAFSHVLGYTGLVTESDLKDTDPFCFGR